MKNIWKIIVVLLLVSAVAAVVVLKRAENQSSRPQKTASDSNNSLVMAVEAVEPKKLPRLVDLGADKCIPCKMMIPVLEELSTEYKGKLQVIFYDVWKNPAYGRQYGIRVIPTQIFLDPSGKELFRHEGFFSKEDILAKWKKFGFDFSGNK
ncbi:MAG: thioredoxin family protein [Planctomycetes bacterium]|nr:thioredoxin family protein [Planctomycetota bacterium]MBU1517903.1 thioredoxin family protein [Planctomycetota bacterium]MBU2458304.1 thioredoxin family protein [Planctomycetota bacterium]MBU2596469.1 thioredoxin family protein [Planctomycetota bacterium]